MAKTYIDIVKYMVEARFEISGIAEKPDIIGAVFGQTEGLLGGGLDLRELQKNGKIGRIEIEVSNSGNRTSGKLFLPSSMPRVETCILGATIESVDRVGPFETSFKVEKIEDTRSEKRRKIINRAKDLLKTLLTTETPDSREISELVESDVKSSVVTSYGPDKLPAGPDIDSNDELILVEGRADVINLLKNDITNCIAVGGATSTISKTIIDLTKSKDTTLFLDGDRGGDMILRGLANVCEIDYVVKAPDGKEVEELTRKDMIKSLRARIPIDQALSRLKSGNGFHGRDGKGGFPPRGDRFGRRDGRYDQHQRGDRPGGRFGEPQQQHREQEEDRMLSPTEITDNMLRPAPVQRPDQEQTGGLEELHSDSGIKDLEGNEVTFGESRPDDRQAARQSQGTDGHEPEQRFIEALGELHNTLRGRLYDRSGNMVAEIPIRELIQRVQDTPETAVVVFDGIITQRFAEISNSAGLMAIYASRAGQLSRRFDNMLLYTKEHGKL